MNIMGEVSAVVARLMSEEAFTGLFLAQVNKKVNKDMFMKTMGVALNGINLELHIDPGFWDSLSLDYKLGILKHEALHIMLMHLQLQKDYTDKKLFNIAADIVVNQYIEPRQLPGGLISLDQHKANVKMITDSVESRLQTGEIDDARAKVLLATIPMRAVFLEDYGFSKSTDFRKGVRYYYEKMRKDLDSGKAPQHLKDMMQSMEAGNPEVPSHQDWAEIEEGTDAATMETVHRNTKNTISNAVQEAKSSNTWGNVPGHLRNIVDKLLEMAPPVANWRAELREAVGGFSNQYYTKSTRSKPNRRMPNSNFPGRKRKNKPAIMCAIDTSGSVSQRELEEVFVELANIQRMTKVSITVVECDAHIDEKLGVYKFTSLKNIGRRAPTGGGGTSFSPPLEYFKKRQREFGMLLYMTDGYAPTPKVKVLKPVIWISTSEGKSKDQFKKDGFKGKIMKLVDSSK